MTPAVNLTERVQNFLHKAVAGSLVGISAGGLAFIGMGCYEIYTRNVKRKQLREQQAKGS